MVAVICHILSKVHAMDPGLDESHQSGLRSVVCGLWSGSIWKFRVLVSDELTRAKLGNWTGYYRVAGLRETGGTGM